MKEKIKTFKDVQLELSDINTSLGDQLHFILDAIDGLSEKVFHNEMEYETFFYEVLPLVKIVRAIASQGERDFLNLWDDVRRLNEEAKPLPAA